MLNQLKTLARQVTPIALDIYDREDPLSLLPFLARVTSPRPGEKRGTWEWWSVFPEMRKWVGDRKTQRLFKEDMEWVMEPFEITFDMDRNDLDSANALVTAADLAVSIARGFVHGKVMLAYKVMRGNLITYDNQNFFDTDHVQPDESTASNIITLGADTPARATLAEPTPQELRAEIKFVMQRFMQNSLIKNTLVSSAQVSDNLVVTAKSFPVWSAFEDLRTEDELVTGVRNTMKGKFQLLRDFDPVAGQGNGYDVVNAAPDGPRPAILVPGREPAGLQFDETQEFSSRYIPFGMDASYAVSPAFWQAAVRVQE